MVEHARFPKPPAAPSLTVRLPRKTDTGHPSIMHRLRRTNVTNRRPPPLDPSLYAKHRSHAQKNCNKARSPHKHRGTRTHHRRGTHTYESPRSTAAANTASRGGPGASVPSLLPRRRGAMDAIETSERLRVARVGRQFKIVGEGAGHRLRRRRAAETFRDRRRRTRTGGERRRRGQFGEGAS